MKTRCMLAQLALLRLLAGAVLAALTGCLPLVAPAPLPSTPSPSPIPTHTATPTSTVVWFPPTATFTPYPTSSPPVPTEEMRPGLGEVLLADDFSATSPWSTTRTSIGSALIGANQLTLTIAEERSYISSVRLKPVLADFYMEITTSTTFCQGMDEYGLLLRYSSPGDFYRFSLSCDGQVRLDRLYQSQASSPQPWLLSGAVPVGAPGRSRLAVWAVGRELRFFVNDEFQFSVRDPQLAEGQLGVFIRASGGHTLTVNFSDLLVRQINP